ncbi:MAG TPA: acetyl-CoA carboxylase biotin carboxylase subunit [Vicinamibacterales bacterium]
MKRLLIANRGEIAVRIIRACRELGISPVAVYSDADADAMHVREADEAIGIGPAPPSESYLRIEAILDAAKRSRADAVHPGYGFLAENAAFAAACRDAGLIFVGPPAEAIEAMGSKLRARALMEAAGVPVVPGRTPEDQSDAGVRAAALAIGLPVLIKASAGGGGKGMRVVTDADALDEAIAAARREASAAFGDGTLYVERLLERPRHVEVQVLADRHGHVVHLLERECSIQRRHQKFLEETPSPALTSALRSRMGEAAVAAARAAGYENAGTIEFLVEGSGDTARFYFLEMNTRLQVEHPITEAVTGIDLVRAQLAIAAGNALPWRQDHIAARGHALECRISAEDAARGFLPQAGKLLACRFPAGPGIRVDAGVETGDAIPVHYDPLIAKLVVHADTREAAIARAAAALRRTVIFGVTTNVGMLLRVLEHPRFRRGEIDTGFVDAELETLLDRSAAPRLAALAAAAWTAPRSPEERNHRAPDAGPPDPWERLEGWRP